MPQSHAAVYVHWVFSTKQRQPFLKDLNVRSQVHSALGGIAKRLECMPIIVGGVSDHVHMLTTLSRNLKMSEAVKEFKRSSNNWIKENHPIDGFDSSGRLAMELFPSRNQNWMQSSNTSPTKKSIIVRKALRKSLGHC